MRTGPGQLQPVWGPRHLRGAASADESWMDGGSIITNYQLPISSFGRRIFSGDVAAAVAGAGGGAARGRAPWPWLPEPRTWTVDTHNMARTFTLDTLQ